MLNALMYLSFIERQLKKGSVIEVRQKLESKQDFFFGGGMFFLFVLFVCFYGVFCWFCLFVLVMCFVGWFGFLLLFFFHL